MVTWAERPGKHKWLIAVASVAILLGLLTAVAAVASMFHVDDGITTTVECERVVKNTQQMVETEAAKIVTDRANIGYDADCDSLDPGGVGGVTTDSLAQIQARMRALGDVRVHTDSDCADQLGKDNDICRYLIYRPHGQHRTYFVRPVADPDDEFSISLHWDERDY